MAGIGSLGERLGAWLDHLLQPLVINLPGFLRDSKQVVLEVEGMPWGENMSWLTCDVTALYPSLPYHPSGDILAQIQYIL